MNDEIKKDFSSYGDSFQKSLLHILINDTKYLTQLKNIIDPDYFDNKYFKEMCKLLLEYIKEHNSSPGFDILRILAEKKEINDINFKKKIKEIQDSDRSNFDFVYKETRDFCLSSYTLKNLEKSLNLLLTGKREESKKFAFEAYKYEDLDDQRVVDVKRDKIKLSGDTNKNPVPTIFPSFNKISKGGPGAGRLFIQVAPSHFGKTSSLISQARTASINGVNTLYISLEDNEKSITTRVLSGLFDMEQEELYSGNHDEYVNKMKEELLNGEFVVKHFRSKNGQISNFKNLLNSYKAQGIFFQLVCIDGLNQVKPEKGEKFSSDNDKFEHLCEELRDWSEEEQMCVACNFQTNRAGFDNLAADAKNIGKAIEVFQVADYVIMYVQDKNMKVSDEAFALLLKNRLGISSKAIKVKIDNGKSVFTEMGRLMDLAEVSGLEQANTTIESIKSIRDKIRK